MSKRNSNDYWDKVNNILKKFPEIDRRHAERLAFKDLNEAYREYAKEGSKRAIKLGKDNPEKYPKDFQKNAELDLGMHRALQHEARKRVLKKKTKKR